MFPCSGGGPKQQLFDTLLPIIKEHILHGKHMQATCGRLMIVYKTRAMFI